MNSFVLNWDKIPSKKDNFLLEHVSKLKQFDLGVKLRLLRVWNFLARAREQWTENIAAKSLEHIDISKIKSILRNVILISIWYNKLKSKIYRSSFVFIEKQTCYESIYPRILKLNISFVLFDWLIFG